MNIPIEKMIIFKGEPRLEKGLAAAYNNHLSGKKTKSEGQPIIVRYIREEKKYMVLDGYHRIVKGLTEGKDTFECKYDWFGDYSNFFWIPPPEQRFKVEDYLLRNNNV